MSSPFATIDGCTTGGRPPTKAQFDEDLTKILDMLGADQKCKETSTLNSGTQAESFAGTWRGVAAVAGGSLLFKAGAVGIGGQWGEDLGQATSQQLDESLVKEGCGSVFANTQDILERMRRINCSVAQNSTQSSSAVSTSATVTLRIEPTDGAYERLLASRDLTLEILRVIPDSAANKIVAISQQLERQTKEIQEFGRVDITESKVAVKAGTQIKQLSTTVQKLVTKVVQDVKNIAKSAAKQTLEQEFGLLANSPNVRSLINEEIERQSDDINTDIAQNISSSRVDVDSQGNITITSPTRINIAKTEITADVNVTLLTTTIVTSAVDLGKQVAQQVISAAMGGSSATIQSKGVDDLAAEFTENNVESVRVQQEAHVEMMKAGNEVSEVLTNFTDAFADPLGLAGIFGIFGYGMYAVGALVLFGGVATVGSAGGGGGAGEDGGDKAGGQKAVQGVPLARVASAKGNGASPTASTPGGDPAAAAVTAGSATTSPGVVASVASNMPRAKSILGLLVLLNVVLYIYAISQSLTNIFSLWFFQNLFICFILAALYCKTPIPMQIPMCLAMS